MQAKGAWMALAVLGCLGQLACGAEAVEPYRLEDPNAEPDAGPEPLEPRGGDRPPGRTFDLTDAGSTSTAVPQSGADAGDPGGAGGGGDPEPVAVGDPIERLVDAACDAPLPTGFCFVSAQGDYIGAGDTVSISGETGLITVSGTAGALHFTAEAAGEGSWRLDLAPAERGHMVEGNYPLAERYPFMDFGAAGLDVSGEGRGCNQLSGAFSVTEAEFDHDGALVRFAASFEQSCETTGPLLRGVIHYEANGEPDPAPLDPDDCSVPLPTGFCFASQAGDYIGAGATIWQSPGDGTLDVSLSGSTLSVSFDGNTFWHLEFDGPDDAPLALGAYEDATRYPFNSPTGAGISIAGDGRGCNELSGRFDVLELETDESDGSLVRAAIDFEQHCESESTPALFGKVRFESDLR